MVRNVAGCVVLLALGASAAHAQLREPLSVKSPRGTVEIQLQSNEPRLRFTVIMNGTAAVEPSPLSLIVDGVDLADGATPVRRENYAVNEQYPVLGGHAQAVNYCEGVRQTLKHNGSGQEYTLDLRAYSDGVAFRFVVPGGGEEQRVPDEATTFILPAGATLWSRNLRGKDPGTYGRRDAAALKAGTWHALPVTFKRSDGTYGAITEANLVNYSGMALEADGQRGLKVGLAHRQPVLHPSELHYAKEDVGRLSQPAAVKGTITTPWRVVMLARDLNELVNCDLVTNLNPAPDLKRFPLGPQTAWVLPGRAVWRHRDDLPVPGDPGAEAAPDARGGAATRPSGRPAPPTTDPGAQQRAQSQSTIQLAQATPAAEAEPGGAATVPVTATRAASTTTGRAAGSTITTRTTTTMTTTSTGPASRRAITAKELKTWSELAGKLGFEYSILEGFWRSWTPDELKDLVDSSRVEGVGIWVRVHARDLRTPEQRAETLKRCVDAGVVGLKIDFPDHAHKDIVDQYHAILKEAAQHKLLLGFEGASKPAGASRTWPNELVRHAVRGVEPRALKERPFHHTVLPFTAFIAGHGVDTGITLDEGRGDTTDAHRVAIPIIFSAPLYTYAAHPKTLLASPAADVIRQIPPVWDETIVLPPSAIGEVALFARRAEDTWFLAVLNGTRARQLKVPLVFLPSGTYTATLVRDGKTLESMRLEKDVPLTATDALTLDLPPGGGFVGVFTKKEE